MQIGTHHHQKLTQDSAALTPKQKTLNKIVDDLIYVIGSLGLLIFIPQLVKVWSPGDISGVSVLSWGGMGVASIFWLTYGLIHKAKPIIFINALAATLQLLIVLGILVHG